MRKGGNRVRISAQLIDATNGHHVWAETYDRELKLDDLLAIQDEITTRIRGAMGPQLALIEQQRIAQQTPQSLDAWDLTMRAMWHMRQQTRDGNASARSLAEQAIEQDPSYAAAFAVLALTHSRDMMFQWTSSPARSIAGLRRAAQRSVSLNSQSALGQMVLASAHQLAGERDEMMAAAERAVELGPSWALGEAVLATYLAETGRAEEAFEHVETARRLSPRDPAAWWFDQAEAAAHFALRRYEQAAEAAQRCLDQNPDFYWCWAFLTASRAHLGQIDRARSALNEMLQRRPELSTAAMERFLVYADRDWVERLFDGLRKAGWEG